MNWDRDGDGRKSTWHLTVPAPIQPILRGWPYDPSAVRQLGRPPPSSSQPASAPHCTSSPAHSSPSSSPSWEAARPPSQEVSRDLVVRQVSLQNGRAGANLVVRGQGKFFWGVTSRAPNGYDHAKHPPGPSHPAEGGAVPPLLQHGLFYKTVAKIWEMSQSL